MTVTSIRAYERRELPVAERLPSLARRFPCLKGAVGLDPFDPAAFHAWSSSRGQGSAAYHAGLLLLNLYGEGPWERFDVLAAVRVWSDADRQMFINWMRVWRF
ncbi:MAG: hypothetical protein M0R80_00315 [Proteobacteria bacterium]|jgi:hypothetical protein|nr:hypothetical protein [Pseudomonadota bacterium]